MRALRALRACCVESMSFSHMLSEAQIGFYNTSRDIRSSPQISFSILPPPSTNAAIPQVRVEEKIKSLGFCSDISHFFPLILTRKKSSITRVLIFNGLAWKQPQLSFELLRACLLCRVFELFSGGLRKKSNLLDFAQTYLIFCP